MIPGAGSSGIVATTWGAARRSRTHGRSDDGNRSVGTLRRLSSTAIPEIHFVDRDSDKRCCIGLTIAERFEISAQIDWRAKPRLPGALKRSSRPKLGERIDGWLNGPLELLIVCRVSKPHDISGSRNR